MLCCRRSLNILPHSPPPKCVCGLAFPHMFSRFCSVWVVLQRQKRPKKEGKVTNVSHAGESIWHCSNSPMVRSPKTQWREGERERERNFFPPEQKDHSKVDGRRRRSRLPVNITAAVSFLGAKNNKFTYRISNHAAFGSANRAAIGRRTKTFKRIKIYVLSCLASLL